METHIDQAQHSAVLETRGGRGAVGGLAYRAKVERVEIGHEHLRVDVLQIPGEALAVQTLAEVHAAGKVSESSLWKHPAGCHTGNIIIHSGQPLNLQERLK